MLLAASISISGTHGVLLFLAAIAFAVAAVIAFFAAPRAYWPSFVALGLCLSALAFLVH
jgi:hypothetical protein